MDTFLLRSLDSFISLSFSMGAAGGAAAKDCAPGITCANLHASPLLQLPWAKKAHGFGPPLPSSLNRMYLVFLSLLPIVLNTSLVTLIDSIQFAAYAALVDAQAVHN